MTERLFDNNAYLWAFDAQVLSCVPRNEYFDVILDRTAFFPEGGGQPADQGTIDQARVLDVHESDGTIHHYTDRPVACGPVHCQLDAARRMDHMQQHSGEHIFSGLVFQHYGFHNVGFHMGSDAITMDFDGTLTREQAAQIESEVNEAIWKNLPVIAPKKKLMVSCDLYVLKGMTSVHAAVLTSHVPVKSARSKLSA